MREDLPVTLLLGAMVIQCATTACRREAPDTNVDNARPGGEPTGARATPNDMTPRVIRDTEDEPDSVIGSLGTTVVTQRRLHEQPDIWRRIDTVTMFEDGIESMVGIIVEVDRQQALVDTVGPLDAEPKVLNDSVLILTSYSSDVPPLPEFWYYNRRTREKVRVAAPDDFHPWVWVFFAPSRPLIAYNVSGRFIVRRWGTWELIAAGRSWTPCGDASPSLE